MFKVNPLLAIVCKTYVPEAHINGAKCSKEHWCVTYIHLIYLNLESVSIIYLKQTHFER